MAVRPRGVWASLLLALSCGCAHQGRLFASFGHEGDGPARTAEARTVSESLATARSNASVTSAAYRRDIPTTPIPLPPGRAIAALPADDCMSLLDRAAVSFTQVDEDDAPHVAIPVYVNAPLYGVSFGPSSGHTKFGMLDCRLALALYAWAPILADAGVVKVEHYSTYRPGARVRGRGKSSGHAHALAIDAARFHLEDGRVLEVDPDWDDRTLGEPPCAPREDESEDSKLLRHVVCAAVEREIFQVVLTPHYDRAHQNHVHLELVPDVDWTYVR